MKKSVYTISITAQRLAFSYGMLRAGIIVAPEQGLYATRNVYVCIFYEQQ